MASTAAFASQPNSDELADLLASSPEHSTLPTECRTGASFSDDIEALHEIQDTQRDTRAGQVIQHRLGTLQDIFRSEPVEPSSPVIMAAVMPSSPPLSPSPWKKRKFADLDFGLNQLARPAKAQRVYYGIDIHALLEQAQIEEIQPKPAPVLDLPTPPAEKIQSKKANLLWTEKYRARKFTDLIGDERTHRSVLHWLKCWDPIVFPGSHRPKPKPRVGKDGSVYENDKPHRKILLLTGPPGLGKTTLAHVCARQAGYEVQEINASDERTGSVVKGRIRDMVGTENVKGVDTRTDAGGKVRKAGKPVCVIVDEVDGVVGSGSGSGGEGSFVKALIDLVSLDAKNSTALGSLQQGPANGKKRKGDRFRLLRPLILICNDVYAPALRPLRQSTMAEVIHVRAPPVNLISTRMHAIFTKEGIQCEADGVRRLCEAAWGVSNRKEDRAGSGGAGEGDMRGIMVVGEWVASKLRTEDARTGIACLTRRWVETNVLSDLSHGGGAARGIGRGGPKEIVDRVFQEGAGFPKSSALMTPSQHSQNTGAKGVAEALKRTATSRLRELVDTHGDTDRIMTDIFSAYPTRPFQDDTLLGKPSSAYEWLHFHDRLSGAVFGSNEWELAPYLSSPVLAFHHLFASPTRHQYASAFATDTLDETEGEEPHPFAGPQASWLAHEAKKHNDALLQTVHTALTPPLTRLFTSPSSLSTEFLPYLLRMLSPTVTPTIVGGADKTTASVRKASEQALVARAVNAMLASGVKFEKTKVAAEGGGEWQKAAVEWVYRMEPPLDTFAAFGTGGKGFGEASGAGKQRFGVRQVLEQEWRREEAKRAEAVRKARFQGVGNEVADALALEAAAGKAKVAGRAAEGLRGLSGAGKRDFFGRAVAAPVEGEVLSKRQRQAEERDAQKGEGRVWVTFHEGFSNAVKKPMTLAELMRGM